MSRANHPYKNLERLAAWKVVELAIADLAENGDIKEETARKYIVGYLVKKLREADALAPDVIVANGIHYHPDPAPVQRN